MRTFTSLKDVLPQALGKVAAGTTSAGTLQTVWAEVVGPQVANNTALVSLLNGTLLVHTANAQWADALRKTADDVLRRMQAKVGGTAIRAIFYEVKR